MSLHSQRDLKAIYFAEVAGSLTRLRISAVHRLPDEISKVQRVTDVGHPAEQIR